MQHLASLFIKKVCGQSPASLFLVSMFDSYRNIGPSVEQQVGQCWGHCWGHVLGEDKEISSCLYKTWTDDREREMYFCIKPVHYKAIIMQIVVYKGLMSL